MPPGRNLPAVVAALIAFNAPHAVRATMAARQSVLGGSKAAGQGRRATHTIAESAAVAAAAAESAAMPAGWKPSRFFGAWKKEVAKRSGFGLFWDNMGYYRGFTPDARKEAIDSVLRTTIMRGYKSDDFYEGVLASHNDYEAMQSHAAAFVDAFWKDFWADHRENRPGCGNRGKI